MADGRLPLLLDLYLELWRSRYRIQKDMFLSIQNCGRLTHFLPSINLNVHVRFELGEFTFYLAPALSLFKMAKVMMITNKITTSTKKVVSYDCKN